MAETFSCSECCITWRDEYTFWHGYTSPCPSCGLECRAIIDDDSARLSDFCSGDPLYEAVERTEEDIEAERETIHEEIAEALGAAEADDAGNTESDGSGGDE